MANQDDLPPDSWDEAEEEALVSRMKTTEISNDTASEEMINKALQNPKDRSTLYKLDEQFERFLSNPELQHIRFKGVSEKHISMVRCVADLFFLKTTSSGDGNICISKTPRSVVPESKFGEPRHVAGRQVKPMEAKPSEQEVKVMRRDAAQKFDDRAARLAAKRGDKKSAEERQQEYLQARARIFNQQEKAEEVAPPESTSAPTPAYATSSSNGPMGPVQGGMGFTAGRGKREGPLPDPAEAKMNPSAPRMAKKAVMTNKLADLQDPDYDRSRFGPKPVKFGMSLSAGAQEFLPERDWGNDGAQFGVGDLTAAGLPGGLPPPVPHPSMGWPGPMNGMPPSYPMWNMGGWGLQPSIPSHLSFPGDLSFSSNGFPSAFPPPPQYEDKMSSLGMYYHGGSESFNNGLQPIGSSDSFNGLNPTVSKVRDYVPNGSANIDTTQPGTYHDSSSYQSDFPALG